MSELESRLDSLLKQFSMSQDSLEKQCEDNLFLSLKDRIPSFDDAAPYFLTQPEIVVVQSDYINEKPRRLQMLRQWKTKHGCDATYLALVRVFLHMRDKLLAEFVVQSSIDNREFQDVDSIESQSLKKDDKQMILTKSPEVCDVFKLIKSHSAKWNEIAIGLKVDENTRTRLLRDTQLGVDGKLDQILHKWNEAQSTDVTWEKILEMLESLELRKTACEVNKFLKERRIIKKYSKFPDFEGSS